MRNLLQHTELIAVREKPYGRDIRTGLCFLIFGIPDTAQVQKPSVSDCFVQAVPLVSTVTSEHLYFPTALSN
jgi:hypothetical protein